MKKSILAFMVAFSMTSVAMAEVTTSQREKAFGAVSKVESLNGSDVADMSKFVSTSSEQDLRNYLTNIAYEQSLKIDNPNEFDKVDFKLSLQTKSINELTQMIDNQAEQIK